MVNVVMIGRIGDSIVRREPGGLITHMQIHTVSVKEDGEDAKQKIHVYGHHPR